MSMTTINAQCPGCGKISAVDVDDMQYLAYQNGARIEDAFPLMNPFSREVLLSGYCFSCQENIFNRPAPGNEAAWGKYIGECDCCGSPLYENRNAVGYLQYKCNSCGQLTVKSENGQMM